MNTWQEQLAGQLAEVDTLDAQIVDVGEQIAKTTEQRAAVLQEYGEDPTPDRAQIVAKLTSETEVLLPARVRGLQAKRLKAVEGIAGLVETQTMPDVWRRLKELRQRRTEKLLDLLKTLFTSTERAANMAAQIWNLSEMGAEVEELDRKATVCGVPTDPLLRARRFLELVPTIPAE